jgi:hypothetical protein
MRLGFLLGPEYADGGVTPLRILVLAIVPPTFGLWASWRLRRVGGRRLSVPVQSS